MLRYAFLNTDFQTFGLLLALKQKYMLMANWDTFSVFILMFTQSKLL